MTALLYIVLAGSASVLAASALANAASLLVAINENLAVIIFFPFITILFSCIFKKDECPCIHFNSYRNRVLRCYICTICSYATLRTSDESTKINSVVDEFSSGSRRNGQSG